MFRGLSCIGRRSTGCFVLNAMEFGVYATERKQRTMRTFFGDNPVFEDNDLVRLAYGAQAMGDHDDRSAFHQLSQGVNHQVLRFGVECSRRLVQDHDWAIANDGARDANTLALASRKRVSAFAYDGVVTVRHATDEFVGVGYFRGGNDLFVGGAGAPVSDIFANCTTEQNRLLQYEADLGPQRVKLEGCDIAAIDQNASTTGIIEAREQTQHGRFSRTRRSDNADDLAGLYFERDIPEHLCFVVIAKRDIFECDCAIDPTDIDCFRDARE